MRSDREDQKFLNLIVQEICPGTIQKFMQEWLNQVCKDFCIIFLNKDLDDAQRSELEYAASFARNMCRAGMIQIASSEEMISPALATKILNSTLELPKDKFEVLKLKMKYKKNGNPIQIQKPIKEEAPQPLLSVEFKCEIPKTKKEDQIKVASSVQQPAKKPKIVCYTCITGQYDTLRDPAVKSDGIDFVCFTDYPFKSNIWKIREIPKQFKEYDDVRKQRLVKILSHEVFKNSKYDWSLWIDANVVVLRDLNDFVSQYDLTAEDDFFVRKHPNRSCIYDEADFLIQKNKGDLPNIFRQSLRYKEEGYPKDNGLVESGILLRKIKSDNCTAIENAWAKEIKSSSFRDQMSFNYVVWKNKLRYHLLDTLIKVDTGRFFRLVKHIPPSSPSSPPLAPSKTIQTKQRLVTIALCNYNTTQLTNLCIRSIIKNSGLNIFKIVVLDNSDQQPFHLDPKVDPSKVQIVDNTKSQYIDFKKVCKEFGGDTSNNHANLKHAYSIQWLLSICQTKGMVLCDSDIVVKKKIDFIDYRFLSVGQMQKPYRKNNVTRFRRILPFLQFFNIELLDKYRLKYFDHTRILGSNSEESKYYDTGASFLEDLSNLETKDLTLFKDVKVGGYINHLLGGSWAGEHDENKFLKDNQIYC